MTTFTTDASRALGGPDWLVGPSARGRRAARRPHLAHLGRGDLAVLGHRPLRPRPLLARSRWRSSVTPGVEPAPGGGLLAAEAGERSGLVVVRNGRVVHHELDPALEAKGVHVCDLATCAAGEAEPWLGMCSDASPDAFTVLHDAFLAGWRVHRRAGRRRGRQARSWCCTGRRARAAPASRTRWWSRGRRPRSRSSTGSRRRAASTSSMPWWSSCSATAPTSATSRCRSTVPRPGRSRSSGPTSGATRTLRSSAVALGGDYARLRSESRLDGPGAESDLLAVYFGDGHQMLDFRTLQDHAAPAHAAATCSSRARWRTRPTRCTRASCTSARRLSTPRRTRPTATSC